MRETSFIEQNKDKWQEFEHLLKDKQGDPEKLSNLYIQSTDDLSYSRTFYPNRSVRLYLNNLAQKVFLNIYKNKKATWKRLSNFWVDELPSSVYDMRKNILIATVIFVLAAIVGGVLTEHDRAYTSMVLGEQYVSMTKANIASGDPMAVYKDSNQFEMFFSIAVNNIRVSYLLYMLGILFGIGTAVYLAYNGLMVGTFLYFFFQEGLLKEALLTIWMHGTIEIACIILAAAAGLTLGNGILFPGSFPRSVSIRKAGVRSIKLMLGITPLFALAAFFEGYLTRYTELGDALRAIFIAVNLAFMLFYFVYYPLRKGKMNAFRKKPMLAYEATKRWMGLDAQIIHSNRGVFALAIDFCVSFLGKLLKWAIPLAILMGAATAFFYHNQIEIATSSFDSEFEFFEVIFGLFFVLFKTVWLRFSFDAYPIIGGICLVAFTVMSWIVGHLLHKKLMVKDANYQWSAAKFIRKKGVFIALFAVFICGSLYLGWGVKLIHLVLFPLYMMILGSWCAEDNLTVGKALQRGFNMWRAGFIRIITLNFLSLLVCLLVLFMLESQIVYFMFDWISGLLKIDETAQPQVFTALYTSLLMCGVFISAMFFFVLNTILFFTIRETKEALWLKQRINSIGMSRSKFGLIAE